MALSLSTFGWVAGNASASKTIEVRAQGMTCGACVDKVKQEVAKIDLKQFGGATVEITTNKATVDLSRVTPALTDAQTAELTKAIEQAVVTAGFGLAPAKANKPAPKKS